MKKEFFSPVFEIVFFKNEDVLMTSGDDFEGEIDWN